MDLWLCAQRECLLNLRNDDTDAVEASWKASHETNDGDLQRWKTLADLLGDTYLLERWREEQVRCLNLGTQPLLQILPFKENSTKECRASRRVLVEDLRQQALMKRA